ncbi:hypothetical protein BGZ83_006400 [Gryganskiella cystojenkinii]|nr:hypothetical protein BGZ83_006400 [Gryganskiella cystojenkinii]
MLVLRLLSKEETLTKTQRSQKNDRLLRVLLGDEEEEEEEPPARDFSVLVEGENGTGPFCENKDRYSEKELKSFEEPCNAATNGCPGGILTAAVKLGFEGDTGAGVHTEVDTDASAGTADEDDEDDAAISAVVVTEIMQSSEKSGRSNKSVN